MTTQEPTHEVRSGDCLDPVTGLVSLADRSVDFVISDPPYEDEAHTKGKRQNPTRDKRVRVIDESYKFAPITEEQRVAIGQHLGRIVRVGALVFGQAEAVHLWKSALEGGGLIYRRSIPWVKPDAMPSLHGKWPGQAYEAIVLALQQGAPDLPIGGKAVYYEITRERGDTRAHPTAKPLALMRRIIEDFTNPGDVVVDPFAGSGSTGVACREFGRSFIGWELDAEYLEIARARIAGAERAHAKSKGAQMGLGL